MRLKRAHIALIIALAAVSCRGDDIYDISGYVNPSTPSVPGENKPDDGDSKPDDGDNNGDGNGSGEVETPNPFDGWPSVDTGLPRLYIDTENARTINSKTTYVNATFSLDGVGRWTNFIGRTGQIRGRGNTTWSWPKKPYHFNLDEKAPLLGMESNRHWVLLANFMDPTLMRNIVAMKVSSLTSLEWTPSCQSVELFLNGVHKGNYLLIEKVRVGKSRVNISEDGYLLELDFHYDNPNQWKDHNIPFAVKYPDPEDITPSQLSYIKGYIQDASNTIYGSSFDDPEEGYVKYIDVDSFIDYWIVYEVMTNHELGNPGSVFFHKEKGGKLVAGPCWDFDWGVLTFNTNNGKYALVNGNAIWYSRLRKDPLFESRLKSRFEELLPELEKIPEFIDRTADYLEASAAINRTLWDPSGDKISNGGNIINGDENLSFRAAVDRIKSTYLTHLEVIRQKL